jgi:hypothetical protein
MRKLSAFFSSLPHRGGTAGSLAILAILAVVSARAEPPSSALFARKYKPFPVDSMPGTRLALFLRAPSFETLVQTQGAAVLGSNARGIIGGIHQARKAEVVGPAAGQALRLKYSAEGSVLLWVADRSLVTGLKAAQARPLAAFVAEGNNGLVGLNDPATHQGKQGYRPKVASSYVDTEEGYWLLWADAIAEQLFGEIHFDRGQFPHGLTIVDSEDPVTISLREILEVRGAEPRVAFWRRDDVARGSIIRYDDLGLIMRPRSQGDAQALEAVRRVFKWAPVMRLAAEQDPVAFAGFARQLEQVPIPTVITPRLLIAE